MDWDAHGDDHRDGSSLLALLCASSPPPSVFSSRLSIVVAVCVVVQAGAGSGEFHTYRRARNLERERVAKMERDAKEEEEREAFERQRAITNFHLQQAANSHTTQAHTLTSLARRVGQLGMEGYAQLHQTLHQFAAFRPLTPLSLCLYASVRVCRAC